MTRSSASPRPGRTDPLSLVLGAVSLAYPFLALVLARPLGPVAVVLALCAVLGLRAITGVGKRAPASLAYASLAAAAVLLALSMLDAAMAMRLYPVLMNAAMLAAFAWSLLQPPSMIERFARLSEPDLSPAGVAYTRAYTAVWCAFFCLNGAVALWTALAASLEAWALYNGAIAYVLLGVLAGGELLIRGPLRRAAERRAP